MASNTLQNALHDYYLTVLESAKATNPSVATAVMERADDTLLKALESERLTLLDELEYWHGEHDDDLSEWITSKRKDVKGSN